MEKDKRLMEASWWERLIEGETGSCSDGRGARYYIQNHQEKLFVFVAVTVLIQIFFASAFPRLSDDWEMYFLKKSIHLIFSAVGLGCSVRIFSGCAGWGCSFSEAHRFLIVVASLFAWALGCVGFSSCGLVACVMWDTKTQTCFPYIGRGVLNHWSSREVHGVDVLRPVTRWKRAIQLTLDFARAEKKAFLWSFGAVCYFRRV